MSANLVDTNSLLTDELRKLIATIPEQKLVRMYNVLRNRTRHITVVTEELHYAYNASAVMRTAECFGIQDLHAIQGRNTFSAYTDIARGAYKWMSLHHYISTQECYTNLKQQGYRIIATSPHAGAKTPSEVSVASKVALIFGNENLGLSAYALEHADEFITIPMLGFTESLNVSVCVSLCIYEMTHVLRTSNIDWQLSQDEQCKLLADWIKISLLD